MTLPPLSDNPKPSQPLIDLGPSRTERYLDRRRSFRTRQNAILRRWTPIVSAYTALLGLVLLGFGIYGVITYSPEKLPPHETVGTVVIALPEAVGNKLVEQIQVSYAMPGFGQHTLFASSNNPSKYGEDEEVLVSYVPGSPISSRIVSTYTPTGTSGDWVLIAVGSVVLAMSAVRTVVWMNGRRQRGGKWTPKQLT